MIAMDYLEKIKEEFPDLKPYTGDMDWDNHAYSHFKKKNYIKAEELFKKICISEPEHYSGFEGLSYIYYAEGEFKKAEWFMAEALSRARIFLEEGSLDPEIMEIIENNYHNMQEKEPIYFANKLVAPREFRDLYSNDLETWCENVNSATVERGFPMVMEALEQPLPFDFLEQEELDSSEKVSEQTGLQSFFFDYYHELLDMREMDKCRQFLEKYRSCQPDFYQNDSKYYDTHLIQQALFRDEQERVKNYLDFFIENPVKGIDELIGVLQLLQYYGLPDEAEGVSRSILEKADDSPVFLAGSSDEFIDIIFFNTLERFYYRLKNGEQINTGEVAESMQDFMQNSENSIDEDLIADIILALSPGDDRGKLKALLQDQDRITTGRVYYLLGNHFGKYMLEQKGIRFAISGELVSWLIKVFLDANPPQENLSSDFFAFPQESFRQLILRLGGLLSNQWPKTAALIWITPYFYDFLLNYDLIEETYHEEALKSIGKLKKEFIQSNLKYLWEYSFVHKWPPADSVTAEEHFTEKEQFEKTFWEKPERDKTIPWDLEEASANAWPHSFVPEDKNQLTQEQQTAKQKELKKRQQKKKEAKKQKQKQRQKKKKRKK